MSDTWQSPYVPMFKSLLEAVGWQGLQRNIIEAMPHDHRAPAVEDLRETLHHLNIELFEARANLQSLSQHDCPCLFIADDGQILAVIAKKGNQAKVQTTDDADPYWVPISNRSGKLLKLFTGVFET